VQLEYEAKERSPVERRRYQREISCYPPEYLIFLDEMSTTGPKFRRRRGRIRNGQRAVMVRPLGPPGQTGNSLIAACNIRGVMVQCCVITYQNLTKEGFKNYIINTLGPHLQPYPGPNSIVVLDNCTLHFDYEMVRFIYSRGARLVYLSPYSPDYNPIE
jgi:hypothetical protein